MSRAHEGRCAWRTGKVAWKERGYSKAQALFADGKLLFLTEDGRLVLARVSPERLEILAEAQVTASVSWSLPTLVGATLYLRDQENVLALDLGEDGRPVKRRAAKTRP